MATQFPGRDSNPRRAVQRVLSPPPLATWLPRKMDSDRLEPEEDSLRSSSRARKPQAVFEQSSPALEAGVVPLDHESIRRWAGDLNTRTLAGTVVPARPLGRTRETPPTVRRRVELRSLTALDFKSSAVTCLPVSPLVGPQPCSTAERRENGGLPSPNSLRSCGRRDPDSNRGISLETPP